MRGNGRSPQEGVRDKTHIQQQRKILALGHRARLPIVVCKEALLYYQVAEADPLARISQCAVKGVLFPAGANPARQLSLQPEALEAIQGGNELD